MAGQRSQLSRADCFAVIGRRSGARRHPVTSREAVLPQQFVTKNNSASLRELLDNPPYFIEIAVEGLTGRYLIRH